MTARISLILGKPRGHRPRLQLIGQLLEVAGAIDCQRNPRKSKDIIARPSGLACGALFAGESQTDNECRSAAHFRVDRNRSFARVDDSFDDGKAKPGSGDRPDFLSSEKRFESVCEVIRGNSAAIVGNAEFIEWRYHQASNIKLELNSRTAVLGAVLTDIPQCLTQQVFAASNSCGFEVDSEFSVSVSHFRPKLFLEDECNRSRFSDGSRQNLVDARERQQILNKRMHLAYTTIESCEFLLVGYVFGD